MSATKLKGLAQLNAMKAALPPATARRNTGKGEGEGFYLRMPEATLQALRVKAAEQKTTARMLVLEALRKTGYPVPPTELIDRRRKA